MFKDVMTRWLKIMGLLLIFSGWFATFVSLFEMADSQDNWLYGALGAVVLITGISWIIAFFSYHLDNI